MGVCCLDEAGLWGDALTRDGVYVNALKRTAGFHPMLGRAVARAARDHGANIIHSHQYSPFVYACFAKPWRPSLRIIFTEHGRLSDAPPSAKRQIANRALAFVPDKVFAVSSELKHYIVSEGFPSARVAVIHNGIECGPVPNARARTDTREQLGVTEHTLVIGTIARLDPVKDLGTLIRGTAMLARQQPAVLVIVGDGAERYSLEQIAAEIGAQPYVRFLGHRDDARAWLAGCDVYANSSISEGISLTILEAMAAALPVVATRVGGTPEIIDETCGRLVPARDPSALAGALQELASNPVARAALGRAARQRVETEFTIERMVREYRDAYYNVVNRAVGSADK
jgi:glycosyltransferase involved in cell wall biosynthesis